MLYRLSLFTRDDQALDLICVQVIELVDKLVGGDSEVQIVALSNLAPEGQGITAE